MVVPVVVRLLRLASIVICAIAIVSFAVFALDRTSSASSHQQAEVNEGASEPAGSASRSPGRASKSAAREALDKAFSALSSPFSSITPSSSDEWTIHVVDTILVLLVYGFGLGFLARLLRLGL